MKYDKDLEKILYKSLRVGVYCRVSTYQKVQESSLVYQNEGLIRQIKEKTNWKFCGSFIDVATGTNMKKQKELNKLISKCLNKEIDIIVTKSASRFSRNIIEALITINKLIANGIAIFFDIENILVNSEFKHKFLLTMQFAMAQEEVVQMSNAISWAYKRKYEQGMQTRKTKCFGYDYNQNGDRVVNTVEAEIVRFIYNEYANGNTAYEIAKVLNNNRVKTTKENGVWRQNTIMYILRNEV